jgi:hypothetical protein
VGRSKSNLVFFTDIANVRSALICQNSYLEDPELFAGVRWQIVVNWTTTAVHLVPGFEIITANIESQGRQAGDSKA